MKKVLAFGLMWLVCILSIAQTDVIPVDTVSERSDDTISVLSYDTIPVKKKKPFYKKIGHSLHLMIDEFNAVDSNFVELQKYKFTAMAQATYSYESYVLSSKSGQSIRLAPKAKIKVGPYFGWKLIFLGYTIGFSQISIDTKKEIDLSLYTSAIGIDLFYRRTGNDYNIRSVYLGDGIDTKPLRGLSFDGLKVGITGFNIYYITNHHKFSYPAAFSQSTRQLVSCGSPIFGIGYTRHSLDFDFDKLQHAIDTHIPAASGQLDEGLRFSNVKYKDISISGGYAYNFVFTKNLLVAGSLSMALGYKHSSGDRESLGSIFRDFSVSNFNIDWVGRLGFVWNTSKWYAGGSAIIHSYNYSKKQFSTTNYFGSVNIYFGVNFGRKRNT